MQTQTMRKRNHFSHLPDSKILEKALEIEAKRAVFTHKHFPDFNLFISWMKLIGLNADFFEKTKNWQNLIDHSNKLRKKVAQKTITAVKNNDKKLISVLEAIEKYLGKEDLIPKNIDVLFVFGSKDLGRIQKAVNYVYKNNNVKKIIIAGCSRYDSHEKSVPEAFVFENEALSLGVPKEKIITEPRSITIADNVRTGLNLMDNLNFKYGNIVTMVSWFAQRRAWAHLKKYSKNTNIYRVNSDPKTRELSPREWYKNEIGINVVFSEFLKMKMAVMIDTA